MEPVVILLKMENNFLNIISKLANCSNEQLEGISLIAKKVNISKGEFYIQAGENPKSFAFVIVGLFRYFYTDKSGNEFTKGFFPENSIITSYSALIENRASYFTIEALEESKIIVIDYKKWQSLANNNYCWLKFLIAVLEKGYCVKESREREFLLFNAEERYLSFQKKYPGLEKRIKQHFIASYLGISPVSLSRIRRKLNN
jgi:CRP-like cAMP-binding protein